MKAELIRDEAKKELSLAITPESKEELNNIMEWDYNFLKIKFRANINVDDYHVKIKIINVLIA
jgi:hypothetical protein